MRFSIKYWFLAFTLIVCFTASAQNKSEEKKAQNKTELSTQNPSEKTNALLIPASQTTLPVRCNFLSPIFNRVFTVGGLDSFYNQLVQLKKGKISGLRVIHIGDSHVKAGFFPGEIGHRLQLFFGDALHYDAFGIIGASYKSYIRSNELWDFLTHNKADLYIISLGTNDAQQGFRPATFLKDFNTFISKLRETNPVARILITTAAGHFINGYSHPKVLDLNKTLFNYCNDNDIPIWDLYRIGNGITSAYNWKQVGLMTSDGVHFNAKGYKLHGALLFQALASGYNQFAILH